MLASPSRRGASAPLLMANSRMMKIRSVMEGARNRNHAGGGALSEGVSISAVFESKMSSHPTGHVTRSRGIDGREVCGPRTTPRSHPEGLQSRTTWRAQRDVWVGHSCPTHKHGRALLAGFSREDGLPLKFAGRKRLALPARAKPVLERIHVDVVDGSNVQSQQLGKYQPADHGQSQRAA